MENYSLKKAATDTDITAVMFLSHAVATLASQEMFIKKYATEALILKSTECTLQEFHALQDVISKLDTNQFNKEYLAHCCSIGYYFDNCESMGDHLEVKKSVLWLIENDPKNGCLEMPYCTDIETGSHEIISAAWNESVAANPDDVHIINNAAQFFFIKNPERSKELLERCVALEPTNSSWNGSLKELKDFHSKQE